MGFDSRLVILINTIHSQILISLMVLVGVSRFTATENNFHINRYFLQIDNVFDYKSEDVLRDSHNACFYNSVETDWILQPLDHFNPLEEHSFWQKYFYLDSKERCPDGSSKCPICIFIGGDAAIHPWWLEHTFLAQKCVTDMRGKIFLLEHRFYGDSAPINSTTVDTMKYLTVSQALEDISTFITFIRKLYRLEKNKLFVFGASYGGTLAALFRRKYPHMTCAAVALSAPMFREYQDKEYLPSIGKKLRNTDLMCYKQIELGLRQASRLMENHICSKQEYPLCQKIRDNFGLCSSLKGMTKMERRVFFSTFIKDFAFLGEYDGVLNVTLRDICDVISNPDIQGWTPLDKLLQASIVISQELFRSKTRAGIVGGGECLEAKKQVICDYLVNENDQHEVVTSGRRARLWQKCTELGTFRTSTGDSKQHPFGPDVLPPNFQQDFCLCAFGERFSQSYTMDRLRNYYRVFGSFSPSSLAAGGSRIIYTIGEDDPVLQRELRTAQKIGTKLKASNENEIFRIKGSAHCGEVFLKSSAGKKRMKGQNVSVVQQDVVNKLMEWLQ